MSHGAGGKATHKLIEGLLLPAFENPALAPLSDAALLPLGDAWLALSTDSYVVRPLVFPGGSIGELAVNGTVNDLAVSGATPLALSAALIIEEGLETEVLAHEIEAMASVGRERRGLHRHRGHQSGRARQGRRALRRHHGGWGRGPGAGPLSRFRPSRETRSSVPGHWEITGRPS